MNIVIIGGGPAGRAAAALLPEARLLSRPQATVFDAEPAAAGWRLWVCDGGEIAKIEADRIMLAAPHLQLALAFGCDVRQWRPVVDATGRTSVGDVWACGAILGAAGAEPAARQGRIVAADILGQPPAGAITVAPALAPGALPDDAIVCDCLGLRWRDIRGAGRLTPAELANLFHLRAGECRMRRCGPHLGPPVRLAPARPVPLMALAAMAGDLPLPPPLQPAGGRLE